MRRIVRIATLACVILTLAGVSKCGSDGSTDKATPEANVSVNADDERCAAFRAALDKAKLPKSDARLDDHQQDVNMYKRQQALNATLARIFPSASEAARALSVIYGKAAAGDLPPAEEAKIAGYDDKIGEAIYKYCPDSGYPAN